MIASEHGVQGENRKERIGMATVKRTEDLIRIDQEHLLHGFAPNFYNGMRHQEIMDAILLSQRERRWVTLALEGTRHL